MCALISNNFFLNIDYRPKPNELLEAPAFALEPENPPKGNPPPNDEDEAWAFALEPEKPPPPWCGYPLKKI